MHLDKHKVLREFDEIVIATYITMSEDVNDTFQDYLELQSLD